MNHEQYDLWLYLPLVAHALASLRYAAAYFMFPRALDLALEGLELGPLKEHIVGTRQFVLWCAKAHIVMTVIMLVMLATMNWFPESLYIPVLLVYWVGLIPIILGGEFSHYRAMRLKDAAPKINDFLRSLVGKGL